MGKMNRRINFCLALIGIWGAIFCFLITASGCSTASWVIHHNAKADDLIITEADVDAMIDELSIAQPTDSDAIVYDETTDRYELTSDAYKKAIRDGIIRRIQDNKIREFLNGYRRETFVDAVRKDVGTTGAVILLIGILAGFFY